MRPIPTDEAVQAASPALVTVEDALREVRGADFVLEGYGAEARRIDPAFGGLIEETHACRGCGNVESRRQ